MRDNDPVPRPYRPSVYFVRSDRPIAALGEGPSPHMQEAGSDGSRCGPQGGRSEPGWITKCGNPSVLQVWITGLPQSSVPVVQQLQVDPLLLEGPPEGAPVDT